MEHFIYFDARLGLNSEVQRLKSQLEIAYGELYKSKI